MLMNGEKILTSHQKLYKMLCFPFFTTSEVNCCLRLESDLEKGKWGKNIIEQAANSYREISVQ
jgi:hypothetical protein